MNMNNFKFDPTPIWHRNITIKGVNGFERKYPDIKIDTLKYIHNLIKNKLIKIDHLKILKIKIENWKELFSDKFNKSIKKAIIFNK